jgi:phospholipase A1/A2
MIRGRLRTPSLVLFTPALLWLLLPAVVRADEAPDPMTKFALHRDNYFLLGSGGATHPLEEEGSLEAKFQVSARFRLKRDIFPGATLYLGYTQKSFWDIGKESSPFRESNYNPELYLDLGERSWPRPDWQLHIQVGFEHESNGRNGSDSRSWNRFFLEPRLTQHREVAGNDLELALRWRVWPLVETSLENRDIKRYYGWGELGTEVEYRNVVLAVCGRGGTRLDRGNLLVDVGYLVPKWDVHLLVQGFTGYGESLIDYDQRASTIRLGVLIRR